MVDDELLMAEFVRRVLRRDYTITMNVHPVTALEALLGAPQVDVVISDVMMSPITGIELYEAAVAARPALAGRFIFMTGGATTELAKRFLLAIPTARLLEKPFSPADLEAAVRALVAAEPAFVTDVVGP